MGGNGGLSEDTLENMGTGRRGKVANQPASQMFIRCWLAHLHVPGRTPPTAAQGAPGLRFIRDSPLAGVTLAANTPSVARMLLF